MYRKHTLVSIERRFKGVSSKSFKLMTLLHRTCMDDKMYPRKAYNMLLNIQKQNYTTCACSGRNVLYKFDFGVVWEM